MIGPQEMESPTTPESGKTDEPVPTASSRILYAEDDPVARKLVEAALGREGYSVQTVTLGEEWDQAVRDSRPDMCLLDLDLPDCSGLDLLKRLKARHPDVPAMFLTASGEVKNVVNAVKLGAVDYLTKPVEPSRLVVSVRNAFQMIRQKEEIDRLLRESGRKAPRIDIDAILRDLVARKGSDLHLKIGRPPLMRISGELVPTEAPPLEASDMEDILRAILGADGVRTLERTSEFDASYTVRGVARFRINALRRLGQLGAVLRSIPLQTPTLEEFGHPDVLKTLCDAPQGMVLVTGPTGSGKSTTLASMIDHINRNRARHIITIEDPVEFIYTDQKSVITQRQLGSDVQTLNEALRRALRQDPDVILVGEMRDPETIQLAMHAAETGHLVFSTLHTNDAKQTLDRIVETFPADASRQVRAMLALTLKGVVSQRLVRRADGQGRVAAMEVMINTPNIRDLIHEGKVSQIDKAIEQSAEYYKTQTFNMSLASLVRSKTVTEEEALATSSNPGDLKLVLKGITRGAGAGLAPPKAAASAGPGKMKISRGF